MTQIDAPYKIFIKANDYPDSEVRAVPLEKGDTIFITSSENIHIGDQYKNYNATISYILYATKKWWKIWEKKKSLGYQVTWN